MIFNPNRRVQIVSSELLLQVKAAFTRAYNKEAHLTPYSLLAVKKSRRGGEADVGGEDGDQMQESEEEGENLQTDAMIKVRTIKSASGRCSLVVTRRRPFCSRRRTKSPSRQRRRKIPGSPEERPKPRPRSRPGCHRWKDFSALP